QAGRPHSAGGAAAPPQALAFGEDAGLRAHVEDERAIAVYVNVVAHSTYSPLTRRIKRRWMGIGWPPSTGRIAICRLRCRLCFAPHRMAAGRWRISPPVPRRWSKVAQVMLKGTEVPLASLLSITSRARPKTMAANLYATMAWGKERFTAGDYIMPLSAKLK